MESFEYGGDGHTVNTYGPACDYDFPGTSDSTFIGTHGIKPNGPVNWTDGDRNNNLVTEEVWAHQVLSHLLPGNKMLDLALVWARDYTGSDTAYFSVPLLFQRIAAVQKYYKDNIAGNCEKMIHTGIKPIMPQPGFIRIYPNPASDKIHIDLSNDNHNATYRIFNLLGSSVAEGNLYSTNNIIPVNNLSSGMYLISITRGNEVYNKKLIIQK